MKGRKERESKCSELLDAVEMVGIPKGLPQRLPIFDVTRIIMNPGIEDIVQGISPEEEVTDDPHALSEDLMRP